MEIFTKRMWYSDWIPYMYGPFSRELLNVMDRLENEGIVNIRAIKDPFGQDTKEYSLTDAGRQKYSEVIGAYMDQGRRIRDKLSKYNQSATNLPLLRKVYGDYPEYAARSLISEDVVRD